MGLELTALSRPATAKATSMRFAACFSLIAVAAAVVSAPARAQDADDDLKIYAVTIPSSVGLTPLKLYGVYLGDNTVLTAAHVVGRWSLFSNPSIIIAGQTLSATVIKKGSFPDMDLALLTVDEATLPISLRLRRNPVCKAPPTPGTNVIVAYPDKIARSRVISPQLITSKHDQAGFSTIIRDVQISGAGAFDADRKCLLGIMSAAVPINHSPVQKPRAGYFVPASKIADFIPAEFRF